MSGQNGARPRSSLAHLYCRTDSFRHPHGHRSRSNKKKRPSVAVWGSLTSVHCLVQVDAFFSVELINTVHSISAQLRWFGPLTFFGLSHVSKWVVQLLHRSVFYRSRTFEEADAMTVWLRAPLIEGAPLIHVVYDTSMFWLIDGLFLKRIAPNLVRSSWTNRIREKWWIELRARQLSKFIEGMQVHSWYITSAQRHRQHFIYRDYVMSNCYIFKAQAI